MLAVHDVNVTSPALVMTPVRGSKVASEVLSPAQTDLRRHGFRLSVPLRGSGITRAVRVTGGPHGASAGAPEGGG